MNALDTMQCSMSEASQMLDGVKASTCSTRLPSVSDTLGDDSIHSVHKGQYSLSGGRSLGSGDNMVAPANVATPTLPTLLSSSRDADCKMRGVSKTQRVNETDSEQVSAGAERKNRPRRISMVSPCHSRRPRWDISTNPAQPTGVELMPAELEKRGVFWGDILLGREQEKTPEVARIKQHLAENQPPALQRGGAQSKATKAFHRHPRVWAKITPPARREAYTYYPKMEHDSRDQDADFVDAGVQRAMLRMNPRIKKYFDWFDGLVENLQPAAVEICEEACKLQHLGIYDDAFKNALLQRIQDSIDNADVQQGSRHISSAAAYCVKQGKSCSPNSMVGKPGAKTERTNRLRRDLLMFLASIEANEDDVVDEAKVPNHEFLKMRVIQLVDCFFAQALLLSSRT